MPDALKKAAFKILSWPFPFLWIQMAFNYSKWGNRRQRREMFVYGGALSAICAAGACLYVRFVFEADFTGPAAYLGALLIFDLLVNTLAAMSLKIPDRTVMTFKNEPRLSCRDVADSTKDKLVLGASGKDYVLIDWYSEFNKKHLLIYSDLDGTGAGKYPIYLAWCASVYQNMLLVFCDSGKASALDFPTALQSEQVLILNSSTEVNKFFLWLHREFLLRYNRRRTGSMPAVRIVVVMDDETTDALIFQNQENPTLRPIISKAKNIIIDGKSQNIHFIATAAPARRRSELPADIATHVEAILFYYHLSYRNGTAKPDEANAAYSLEESPVAHFGDRYRGKILDTFVIWRNQWLHCRAPVISDVDAGKEISANLKTTDLGTLELRQSVGNAQQWEAEEIETYQSRYHGMENGGLKLRDL